MTRARAELSRATVTAIRTAKSGIAILLFILLNVVSLHSQTADALLDKLIQKGILTEKEADELRAESAPKGTNTESVSKWNLGSSIKKIELYGDLRFRYEYRAAENAPGSGEPMDNSAYMRERFRYAARLGLRGTLYDDFYWGIRLDTATNPRSPWVTFGDDSNPSPFAKNSDAVGIGQVFIGWRPEQGWYEVLFGKMPQPLYTTTMVWDNDYNPEGAFEKLKYTAGPAEMSLR